jgi:diguanylate cyclase (GGDEF)-like protein
MHNQSTKMETMKKLAGLISMDSVGEMLEHIHAMVVLVEREGTLISWNRAFESHKAVCPHAENLQDCFPEKEKKQIHDRLSHAQRDQFVLELGLDGDAKTIFCDCMLIPLADERALFVAERFATDASLQEVIQRLNRRMKMFQVESESAKKIARNKQIEVDGIVTQANEVAQVDALTFLPNRRMIVRELQDEVLRAERYKTPLSISVADVDFFKRVNDIHGHIAGDEVLRHVAYQLRDHIRHPDLAGRYGGEEFLILLPNTASREAAEQAARLCKYVRETNVNVNGHILNVTISIGVAQFRHGVDTWDTLLNRADNAMYEAKNSGRDRLVVAD